MAFNRRVITKELDIANLAKHNDNYADIKTELDAHESSISSHVAAQTAHGSTSAATAGKIMQRDANGRAKVAAPIATDDIARKAEVDVVQTNLDTHEADADVHLSADDRTKFNGIEPGAEPNQNAFAQVNDVVAAVKSDALTIEGGTGITITTNPTTKKVIVTATGDATPGAHGSSHNIDGADPIPDLIALRSEFDALTPSDIGAETPSGAQAKVDALAGVGNTKTVKQIGDEVADITSSLDSAAINVKSYGAVGDGVADDTGPLQEAINAALAGRKTVYLPSGSYRVTSSLNISSVGFITLRGEGGPTRQSTIDVDFSGDAVIVSSSHFVEISSIRFNHKGSTGRCIALTNGESHSIRACSFQNIGTNTADMIYYVGANTIIEGCRIDNYCPSAYAIRIRKIPDRININSSVLNNNFGAPGRGIIIDSTDPNGRPEGVLIKNNCFILTGDEQVTIRSVFYADISHNIFDQSSKYAVMLWPSGTSITDVSISENYIAPSSLAAGRHGITKISSSLAVTNIRVSNNTFKNWEFGLATVGASFDTNWIVKGNIFNACTTGIKFDQTQKATVTDNIFTGCAISVEAVDGPAGGPFLVKDNHFSGSLTLTKTNTAKFRMAGNVGYVTSSFSTANFPADSTGVKYVTIPHGLSTSPNVSKILLTRYNAGNDDFAAQELAIVSVTSTAINARIKVITASTTSGRVGYINAYAEI